MGDVTTFTRPRTKSPLSCKWTFVHSIKHHLGEKKTMNFRSLAGLGLAALTIFLTGCGTIQKPVALKPTFWEQRQAVVGIAVAPVGKPTAQMMGAQGLLDIAINTANAKAMVERMESTEFKRLAAIPANIGGHLKDRGFTVKVLEQPVDQAKLADFSGGENFTRKDFRSLASQGIERLLLIEVVQYGTTRNYYGFLPLGAPSANMVLKGSLIDLKTNELLWYQTYTTTRPVSDPWDQTPEYPNVIGAVTANIDAGSVQIERALLAAPAAVQAAR